MKPRYIVSVIATLAVLVVSVGYLCVGVLNLRIGEKTTTVTIIADKSNGLHAGSAVLLGGVAIGQVTAVSYRDSDIAVTATYDSRYSIPADSRISIENQSMLGESGLFLAPPPGDRGTPIADGATLSATPAIVPASVPELLGSTQRLLDQVDPTLVNQLVGTITTAMAGTEDDIDRLTPAARVLAATMIYSQPALTTILQDGTTMLQDGQWIGPATRPIRPQLLYAGASLRKVITNVRTFADFTQGGKIIQDSWRPALNHAAAVGTELTPSIGGLYEALLPYAQSSGSLLSNIDFATLLENAMHALPGDSLQLDVNSPK